MRSLPSLAQGGMNELEGAYLHMRFTRIEGPRDERAAAYFSLTDRQLRSRAQGDAARVILESLNAIVPALAAGVELESVLVDERHLETLLGTLPALEGQDVEVLVAHRDLLSSLTGINKSRGYLACARRPPAWSVEEVVSGARRLAVLEGLTDVANVGALFRSAAALGADGIVLAPTCADPLNRRGVRVSMGTVFSLPWAQVESGWPAATLGALRDAGFYTAALALADDALMLGDPALHGHDRLALLFGSEGWGLTDEALACCDARVMIPMGGGVDSLNVAASSAVAFWELFSKGV